MVLIHPKVSSIRLRIDESRHRELDGAVVNRLWQRARVMSGMGEEAEETAAEDFGTAQDDGSSTE